MRHGFAVIDAGLVGIAVHAMTGNAMAGFIAGVAVYALIIARRRTEPMPPETRDDTSGRPLVHDAGEHAGSPSAGLWHGFKWILAVGILATSMGRHGRVGAGPIAAAGLLLRRRKRR
jgi:hypothetical protein